jgi:hypothetical protein
MTVTGTASRSKSSNSRALTPTFGLSKSGLPVDQSGDCDFRVIFLARNLSLLPP